MAEWKNIEMPCQICSHPTRMTFSKERNVSCGDYFVGRRLYQENLGEVVFSECTKCGFGSFDDLQGWSAEKFHQEIYNDDYHLCDPPFRDERPRKLAAWLVACLGPTEIIDYGGGEGLLSTVLGEHGFQAHSFDPFYGKTEMPARRADVVTAFEVVEHVPKQYQLFGELRTLCKSDGLIVFSTLLKPMNLNHDWWYASARNGHVSFHTEQSIGYLMMEMGLKYVSLSTEMHVAARDEILLDAPKKWIECRINGAPQFEFDSSWERMIKLPTW